MVYFNKESNMNNKVAVVTGASAGIGEATVKRLIEQGYTTYAAERRLDRMANLEKLGAILLPLDLTDDTSIVQAAERIRTEQGHIDVLLNNAGYGLTNGSTRSSADCANALRSTRYLGSEVKR
jgi:NADP-dependent 3-hydroxy acid dehydrogenase YdfG